MSDDSEIGIGAGIGFVAAAWFGAYLWHYLPAPPNWVIFPLIVTIVMGSIVVWFFVTLLSVVALDWVAERFIR